MTSKTGLPTFLGRPILGDLGQEHPKRKGQWSAARFGAALQDVFAADPDVKAVAWRQYTPYFNDGDPCLFSVDDPFVLLHSGPITYDDDDDFSCEEIEEEDGDWGFVNNYDYTDRHAAWSLKDHKRLAPVAKALGALDMEACEDVLLDTFGDHVTVIAYPDRFAVECYDHD